jgi:hypothetical protein
MEIMECHGETTIGGVPVVASPCFFSMPSMSPWFKKKDQAGFRSQDFDKALVPTFL